MFTGAGSGSPTAGGLAALQFADIQKTVHSYFSFPF